MRKVSHQKSQSTELQPMSNPSPKRIQSTDVTPITYKKFDDFKLDLEVTVMRFKDELLKDQNNPDLKAQLKTAEKNLERAEVLYEHYRLGNDVRGPRMLHRRGQDPKEQYRNLGSQLHAINMTWQGQGDKTQDLPILYAFDKGSSAKEHLHSQGIIYDPVGVEHKLAKWSPRKEVNEQQKVEVVKVPPKKKLQFKGNNFLAQIQNMKTKESKQPSESFKSLEKKMKTKTQDNIVESQKKPEVKLGHDMQSNFAWLLGAMHNGEPFELVGPLTERSLARGSNEEEASALLREIRGLLRNGYELKPENQTLGTKQNPIIVLTPKQGYDPDKVTLESLDQSAPVSLPDEEEKKLYREMGLLVDGFDDQKQTKDLNELQKSVNEMVKERAKIVPPLDHSHGKNLEQFVVKNDRLGVVKGQDELGISSQR
ncbi:hypothetical protein [Acanthopleuribacter pedis]|uniref:Uncharacterized protein n=1 Tax=Acanthopleuribacter pedis TaxID=442870 RepID=A0A8J7U5F9_9BACT|nr:hypothetical protein [Acanthopleuribacter pedis]MBO1319281.1 hypothetical protein [Acanthopleuribacter pedis]